MADGKTTQEPSMEEILSSIRRIIAEEDGAPPRGAADGADEDDDVLELTEIVGGPEPVVTVPTAAAAPPAVAVPTAPPANTAQPTSPEPPMPIAADTLVSPIIAEASAQALARLTRAGRSEERKLQGAGVTVEELVVELLTPMLRDWLDRNLPGIVERVVEQEVKKLARRAELM